MDLLVGPGADIRRWKNPPQSESKHKNSGLGALSGIAEYGSTL